MARSGQKPPRIVAELGRPETPQETADRKAENSRRHRANQTLINLVVALVASLGVVVFIVTVVVRDPAPRAMVDFAAVAAQSQSLADVPLSVPALPPDWAANSAELRVPENDVTTWYVGFITPAQQFIALNQGIESNPTWLSALLDPVRVTGSETIDGRTWDVYDNRDGDDPGNLAYAMVTSEGDTVWVLNGTADEQEFRTLATTLGSEIDRVAEAAE